MSIPAHAASKLDLKALDRIGIKTGKVKVGIAPKSGVPRVKRTIPFQPRRLGTAVAAIW